MSFLVHPLPPIKVLVRKEFLRDMEDCHGEYLEGYWISVKSVTGKALYFETLITEYGALYDKLPISAFCWKNAETELLPLDHLQIWDCFDYHITVIKKPILGRCEFLAKNRRTYTGDYLFTIDTAHPNDEFLDVGFSQFDPEHKSFNIIKLDNGQFAAQPNNRIIWRDSSLIPSETKRPDFKVCTQNYKVENTDKWSVAHSSEWRYLTEEESEFENGK
jgi:hypothetical protein